MEAILSIRTPRTISVILAGGQNRIGPRVHGVVCRAGKSAVNRGISLRASFLAGHRVIRRADWCELPWTRNRWFESISLQRRVERAPVGDYRTRTSPQTETDRSLQ